MRASIAAALHWRRRDPAVALVSVRVFGTINATPQEFSPLRVAYFRSTYGDQVPTHG
jgi:hypothetical protein